MKVSMLMIRWLIANREFEVLRESRCIVVFN